MCSNDTNELQLPFLANYIAIINTYTKASEHKFGLLSGWGLLLLQHACSQCLTLHQSPADLFRGQ